MSIDELLAKLDGVKCTGANQWQARCPAHDDRNPSLSVKLADDGRILLYCHADAGCSIEAICRVLGISKADLSTKQYYSYRKSTKPNKAPTAYRTLQAAVDVIAYLVKGTFAKDWTYHTTDGKEYFRVLRFDLANQDKTYRPVHPNGGGYVIGDPPAPLPLYNLYNLDGATRVYLPEGEKCVDAAKSIDLTAVTSAHGSKSAKKTDWQPLAGREVIILPDADKAGEGYADKVCRILSDLNPPTKVKIVRLPGLNDGQDIYDYLERRNSVETEILREEIEKLADAATYVTPKPIKSPVQAFGEFALSESGNGKRFAFLHADKLRFCHSREK